MKNLQWLFLILLQCSFLFAHTQSKHISFDHIGNAEGLSQSNISSIGEDKKQLDECLDQRIICTQPLHAASPSAAAS